MPEKSLKESLIWGAIGGLIATASMTVAMKGGKFLLGRRDDETPLPPISVTENVTKTLGVPLEGGDEDNWSSSTYLSHFLFGAAAGMAFYPFTELLLQEEEGTSSITRGRGYNGMAFGAAIWGAFYLYILPELRLYKSSRDQSLTRHALSPNNWSELTF